jgi:hypothetical protein
MEPRGRLDAGFDRFMALALYAPGWATTQHQFGPSLA